jgi:nucleoside-diphosphate-sugar epimerase
MKASIFGATGPIGRRVADALLGRGFDVRVVSRSPDNLARRYRDVSVERWPADLQDRAAAVEAARGSDLVVHAVGLPAELFDRHVSIAQNTVAACGEADARAFLVTSYWSYGPGDDGPMPESRPRKPGSEKAAIREGEEQVFLQGGGAVARLPDFYGPEEGVSLLNDGLRALLDGAAVSWPGNPDARRDFIYYADAGRLIVDLALRDEAYGEAWNVPGSGAETPRAILELAARIRETRLRLRRIRPWMARLAALFRSDVRAFLDVMPLYDAPVILDTSKLEGLLGKVDVTAYETGIPATLEWMEQR